jgi:CheY-like chemotaxis protein
MSETQRLSILHIDDVETNMLVMDHLLAALGHEPHGVASAAKGLAAMQTSAFDLVLTDYHMPDASGLDFLRGLRALRGPASATPVIVVTADVMSFSAPSLREMGFASALGKPVMAAAMSKVLAVVVRATGEFIGDGFARASA